MKITPPPVNKRPERTRSLLETILPRKAREREREREREGERERFGG